MDFRGKWNLLRRAWEELQTDCQVDGALILLDLLVHTPLPVPPLTEAQWRGLTRIGERLRAAGRLHSLSTPPHADHWVANRALAPSESAPTLYAETRRALDAAGGLTWNHLRQAREALEAVERAGERLSPYVDTRLLHQRPWIPVGSPEEEVARRLADGVELDDRVRALVDLAQAGQEADFKFLAGAVGVPVADHEAMWAGTVARLEKQSEDRSPQ